MHSKLNFSPQAHTSLEFQMDFTNPNLWSQEETVHTFKHVMITCSFHAAWNHLSCHLCSSSPLLKTQWFALHSWTICHIHDMLVTMQRVLWWLLTLYVHCQHENKYLQFISESRTQREDRRKSNIKLENEQKAGTAKNTFESSDSLRIEDVRHPTISVASQLRFLLTNIQKYDSTEIDIKDTTGDAMKNNLCFWLALCLTYSIQLQLCEQMRIQS